MFAGAQVVAFESRCQDFPLTTIVGHVHLCSTNVGLPNFLCVIKVAEKVLMKLCLQGVDNSCCLYWLLTGFS